MKKFLALLMSICMVFALVACAAPAEPAPAPAEPAAPAEKPAEDPAPAPAEEPEEEEYTIVYVLKYLGSSWQPRQQAGIDMFMEKYPFVDAYLTGANSADPLEQNRVIEDLIAQGVDAIIICPNSTEASAAVMKKAQESGIVTVGHEAVGMEGLDWDLEAFDNQAYGEHLLEYLVSKSGGAGQYTTFVGTLTAASHNAWAEGGINLAKSKYPDLEIVVEKNESNEEAETAYQKTLELLRAYPDLNHFQGSATTDVLGVGRAIEEAGLQESTFVAGTGMLSDAEQYLESGAIDMVSIWDPAGATYMLFELALRELRGETVSNGDAFDYLGYESVSVTGNVVAGSAWVDTTLEDIQSGNVPEWLYSL